MARMRLWRLPSLSILLECRSMMILSHQHLGQRGPINSRQGPPTPAMGRAASAWPPRWSDSCAPCPADHEASCKLDAAPVEVERDAAQTLAPQHSADSLADRVGLSRFQFLANNATLTLGPFA